MTFRTQVLTDLDAVLFNSSEFEETVTYNGIDIVAIVDRRGNPAPPPGTLSYGAYIRVRASDVAAPAYNVPVVIKGATWLTGRPEDAEGGEYTWRIPLMSQSRPVPR